MLNPYRLYCAEQNFELDRLLFGEAFVYKGFICYWNSRHLSVCSAHVNDISQKIDVCSLLTDFSHDVQSVKVFGYENQIDLTSIDSYGDTKTYYESADESTEFVMDTTYAVELTEKTRRRLVATDRSIQVESFDYLTVEDLGLFRSSVPKSMVRMDQIFWWCLPRLQGCRNVSIVRCFEINKLIGAAIVQVTENNKDSCVLMITTDRDYHYVGDSLYMGIRDNFCQDDRKVLIGHAETKGLSRFKKKWGRPGVSGRIVGIAALARKRHCRFEDWLQHMGVWWVETAILQNAGRSLNYE